MPFEWLQASLDAPVSELFARGRRARAIEQIREKLQGQIAPSVDLRMELVDLLIAAGRVREAVPVLLGLADEFARDGFVAKAVAALKRVEKVEPGRSDVEERLARLVRQQQEASPRVEPEAPEAAPVPGASTTAAAADDAFEIDLASVALPEPPSADGDEPFRRAALQRLLQDADGPPPAAPSDEDLDDEILTLAADVVQSVPAPAPEDVRRQIVAVAERLLACDLFASVPEEELLAIVRGLRLRLAEPGEIVVAEGEPGEGLFILASGAVKVFVRNPSGRNVPIARLGPGQYFGEIASLSGRLRCATVTVAARAELLELDAAALRALSTRHPLLARRLEDVYVQRLSSPDAAAVRSVALADAATRARAAAALRRHFGDGRWEPRVLLKLSEALLRAGQEDDALAVLASLADDLLREGFPEKAVAVLRKIERLRSRHVEVVSLAPLPVVLPEDAADAASPAPPPPRAPDAAFQSWLVDVLRERVGRTAVAAPALASGGAGAPVPGSPGEAGAIRAYEPTLRASPLLEGLAEEEQLALLHRLDLVSAQPGDLLVSEGERGDSLYILASGGVRVFARDAGGRTSLVCCLDDGAFFGEISALLDEPRSATVVASLPSQLLKLDRPGLDALCARHPRLRGVLEEYCRSRRRAQ